MGENDVTEAPSFSLGPLLSLVFFLFVSLVSNMFLIFPFAGLELTLLSPFFQLLLFSLLTSMSSFFLFGDFGLTKMPGLPPPFLILVPLLLPLPFFLRFFLRTTKFASYAFHTHIDQKKEWLHVRSGFSSFLIPDFLQIPPV